MFAASKSSKSTAAAAGVVTDPQFNYVTALLNGDGTNGAQNNTFIDSSTNNATITRFGNATQGSFTPYGNSWSNYFNGSTSYLTIPYNAAYNFALNSQICFEAWVYTTSTNTFVLAGRNWSYGSSGPTWSFSLNGGITPTWNIAGTGSATYVMAQSAINGVLGQWNHYAFTRDSSNVVRIFVNGVVGVTRKDGKAIKSATGSIFVGVSTNLASPYANGYMSNVRLVVGSPIYTSAFTPPTSPLTAVTNTQLLTCQSNTFIDNSANAMALTATGSPTVQKFSPFGSYSVTPTSYSTKFNGSTDYLTLPSGNAALQFTSNDFTLEAWVYPLTFVANGNPIFAIDVSGTYYASVRFGYTSSGAVEVLMSTSGSAWALNVSSGIGTVVLNTWQHIALSKSGTSVRVFLNGVQQGATQTVSGSLMTSTNNWIGYLNAPSAQFLNGYISNARIVKGTAVYTSAFTPPTAPLTAITNTSLLTCQSTTIIDNSTNAFTLTATGSPIPKLFNPFGYSTSSTQSYSPAIYGGSGYFDGTTDYCTLPNAVPLQLGTGDFTFEAWVYLNTATTGVDYRIFTNWPSSTGYQFYLRAASLRFIWQVYTQNSPDVAALAITPFTWTHVAFCRSSTTIKTFINGVLVDTTTGVTNSANGNGTPTIAADSAGTNGFNGFISDIRLVKGTAVYTANFTPPTAPLTAITNTSLLVSAKNASIYDSAMISDYETSGTAQVSTSVKKYGTGSIYFATKTDYLPVRPIPPLITFPGNFTFECWVYPTNAAITFWGVWDSRNGGASSAAMVFYLVPLATPVSGSYRMAYFNGTSYYGTGTVLVNQWTHLAWVRSGTTLTSYVNGVAGGTSTVSGTQTGAATTTPIYVGNKDGNLANYGTIGYIDDLRVTNGYARYTANFTPPTAALPTS